MGKSVLLGGKAGALGGVHGAGTSGTIADTDARRGALAAFIMHAAVCTARNRHIQIWMLRVGCVLRALRLGMKEAQQVCSQPHAHGPEILISFRQQLFSALLAHSVTWHSSFVISKTPLL